MKDKWSRVVTGNPMEYSHLEEVEKENMLLMKKRRKGKSRKNFAGSVYKGNYDECVNGGQGGIKNKYQMGFNFAIRPDGGCLGKRDGVSGRVSEVEKYLAKLRKVKKRE